MNRGGWEWYHKKTKANKTENKISKLAKRKNLSEKKTFPKDFLQSEKRGIK